MSNPFNPAETARLDQAVAEGDAALDATVAALRSQIAEDGLDQATANLALAIRLLAAEDRDWTLILAIRRLATS
jgi:hypothetical protein